MVRIMFKTCDDVPSSSVNGRHDVLQRKRVRYKIETGFLLVFTIYYCKGSLFPCYKQFGLIWWRKAHGTLPAARCLFIIIIGLESFTQVLRKTYFVDLTTSMQSTSSISPFPHLKFSSLELIVMVSIRF